ncbi:unnamed protein product [Closterium sp. Naga37s-1]|nr:unnamed protein product [Closterium sp. Naga37s-1]
MLPSKPHTPPSLPTVCCPPASFPHFLPSAVAALAEWQQQWAGDSTAAARLGHSFKTPLKRMTPLVAPLPCAAAVLAEWQNQLPFLYLTGWDKGGDCGAVYGVFCDSYGNMIHMDIEDQPLDAPLPDAIGNLTTLKILRLTKTNLSGSIPLSFSRLTQLEQLDLSYNSRITGSIPQALSSLKNLALIDLSYIGLTGPFPSWLPGLSKMFSITLLGNGLSGSIPDSVGSMKNLERFWVWQNQISGAIPESIGKLNRLSDLELCSNRFTGTIPQSIGSMYNITSLNLANNLLTGSIPTTLSRLSHLQALSFRNNNMSGTLPSWITGLTSLKYLHLSYNNFSGTLPAGLGNLLQLTSLNVTNTSLVCPPDASPCVVPQPSGTAFCQQCPTFCSTCSSAAGGAAAAPPPAAANANTTATTDQSGLSAGAIIGIVVAAVLLLLLLIAAAWWILTTRVRARRNNTSLTAAATCVPVSSSTAFQQFPLEMVTRATNDWAEANLLGSGGYGDVYKGVSPLDGTTLWAVKRAKVITNDFQREVTQMSTKHHPNLVRLLGFAVGGDVLTRVENVLIYEFIANGDLERWMGPDAPTPLTLQQRLDILLGTARGLEYLHSFGIIHRDIKPANILINSNMQPKVADFGLVRGGDGTMASTRVLGTVGYVDPAYTRTHNTTTATDVYSFGVLMLVVLSGRGAIVVTEAKEGDDPAHQPDPTTIVQWASELLSGGKASSLGDSRMAAPEDIVTRIAKLAISCTAMPTASRPSMSQVAQDLEALQAEVGGGAKSASGAARVDEKIASGKPERTIDEDLELLNQQLLQEEGEATAGERPLQN